MKSRYSILSNSSTDSVHVAHAPHNGSHICPRITRTKLVCAFVLVFVFALLLLFQCLGSRFSQFCCPASKTETVHIELNTANENNVMNNELPVTHTDNDPSRFTDQVHRRKKQRNFIRHDLANENSNNYDPNEAEYDGVITDQQLQRRYPQVIIIGVRKGGTRALLEFLNLHPSIVAEKAEMHFFDDDKFYQRGLEWYRGKMPLTYPDQITIEKTPAYFTEEAVPERVYGMNKTCKFLIVVRDPTERAISDYTQIYFNKRDKGKAFETFEELAVDVYGTVNKSYKAIRRSMYYKHMERWLNFFNLRQFHIVDGAKLVSDPVSELSKVEDFMGLEHRLTKDRFYFNSTRGFYCMKLEHKEKCLAKSKGRTHPDVNPKVIKILHNFFKPLNQKFYSIVQRDFGWPTE